MQRELLIGITIVVGFVALIIFALGRSEKFEADKRPSEKTKLNKR